MRLGAWMKKAGISRSKLAEDLGVKAAYITMVLNGKRLFHPKKAQKIIELSGGKVGYSDLYSDPKGMPKQAKGKAA